jgi:hypothetical protein
MKCKKGNLKKCGKTKRTKYETIKKLHERVEKRIRSQIELDSESLYFDRFPERRFELAAKLQIEKLPGYLQNPEYFFLVGFQFREEFLLLQLKCDLLVGGQYSAYSFRNARNREDAAQRLQRFVR